MQSMAGVNGWQGWQWLFLLQGLPTVTMGALVWRYLDDRVKDAAWLSPQEREMIARDIAAEATTKVEVKILSVLTNSRVWLLALMYFAYTSGLYGISFWLPGITKSIGVKGALDIGLLSAIPWSFGVVAMYLVARSADRKLEHRWHSAIAAVVGALGLLMIVAMHGNATKSIDAGLQVLAGLLILGTVLMMFVKPVSASSTSTSRK